MYPDGRVCISILHPPGTDALNEQETADERWRPIISVEAIILSVISLLGEPNLESPADVDAAVRSLFVTEDFGWAYVSCLRTSAPYPRVDFRRNFIRKIGKRTTEKCDEWWKKSEHR